VKQLVVERAADGSALWAVDVADSWMSRLVGLIGRKSLDSGDGLYFPGTNGIHMLFMRFAIDCVFVRPTADSGGDGSVHEVVAVKPNLRPWTGVVWFVRRARGAIELGAGSAARAGINVGDRLRLVSS
jgi:uncharacterized membrane protein (UPF0127 family)